MFEHPLTRRHLIHVGSLGGVGLTLPGLLAAGARAKPHLKATADACIVIFLNGGPSHLDMWDMKPQAATSIRGEFAPVSSALPGFEVCEHLPEMAKQAGKLTVVRSMHHGVNNAHAAAVYASLTGHDRGEIGGGARPTDYPCPGSVVAMRRPVRADTVSHVCLPYITREGAQGPPQPGFFGGFLGRAHDPLFVLKDPNATDFAIPELTLQTDISAQRLDVRRQLFEQLDQTANQLGAASMSRFQTRALDLLASQRAQTAFRVSDEAESVRTRYGRNTYGQSVLLARRLVEAGTRLVTVSWAPHANATWDTHGSNFKSLKSTLLPQFDRACSSLLDDLQQRGLLERTLVAVLGDFGRTPKINANNAGRDHWNYCYSLVLAGGGIQAGLVYGASDRIGGYPARNALEPGDIISTIYAALGIPHDSEIHDQLGRPYRLVPTGDVVHDLLA
ncbi:MAG: DUF1501 domain-containing protein [Planctomycetaceae bacterium]